MSRSLVSSECELLNGKPWGLAQRTKDSLLKHGLCAAEKQLVAPRFLFLLSVLLHVAKPLSTNE